jgi:glycosyltransferase involved in cell wall biosynthesis
MTDGTRIAINASVVGQRPTGLGVYALHLITALDELGERLTVLTSRPEIIAAPHAELRRITRWVRPEHGRVGHLMRLVWSQSGLRLHTWRERPALLLNLMPEGVLRPSVPQVTVVHDLLPLLYPAEYPRQQYYFRHFVPAVLRHSRAVIVISESTRRDLLHFYPGVPPASVHVVLSGYDARWFPPETDDGSVADEPYALYVGNVMPHKNLLRMVDAFAAATRRRPGRLVIRGWGKAVNVGALRERIAIHGLESRVDWRPYASIRELSRLYQRAHMLLLPSLHEGFGLTALEAMACGTPVVTSNTSSLPEVVGDAALFVDPYETATIADAIARLFADDSLAKDLRERGRARANHFSWEKTGRAVQRVIREVLGNR